MSGHAERASGALELPAPIGRLADEGVDWQGLGFRCGLEIHQQLLTDRKLFCRCPAGLYSERFDMQVLRHMRPTLSELGEYDGTALMEFKTRKQIIYRMKRESVCTYEMDDTPPFEINAQAVDIALEIALLVGCNLVGELHVIRKQYLDGSIPAGFQRTAIVGVEGEVPFGDRTLRIAQVSVEEDACREVSDEGHTITYLTDRLSMPLVEIVTYPELYTPSEAGRAAAVLGDLMRTTGKVRRGLGAVRQDVNVSVSGGTRVEIKGVPRIKMIPPLVRNEALRQRALLDLAEQLPPLPEGGRTPRPHGVMDLAADSRSRLLADAAQRGETVMAIRVPGGREALLAPTQPGRRFIDELAGRIRVIACLTEPPYCLADPDDAGMSHRCWKGIRHRLGARAADGVVVCWGPEADVRTALSEVLIRMQEARVGVPNETRQALPAGITDFERILPGPNRMYPDTDSPPTAITDERIAAIQSGLPVPSWQREVTLRTAGVPAHQVRPLARSPRYELADRLIARGVDGRLVALLLAGHLRHLQRSGWPEAALNDGLLTDLATRLDAGELHREIVPALLQAVLEVPDDEDAPTLEGLCDLLGLGPLEGDLETLVRGELGRCVAPSSPSAEARQRYAMGQVMAVCRGRVAGREVAAVVGRVLAAGWPAEGADHGG